MRSSGPIWPALRLALSYKSFRLAPDQKSLSNWLFCR